MLEGGDDNCGQSSGHRRQRDGHRDFVRFIIYVREILFNLLTSLLRIQCGKHVMWENNWKIIT